MNKMDDKIREQLSLDKIKDFKNPTILMNSVDFNRFKEDLESNIVNYHLDEYNAFYMDIPIKKSQIPKVGEIIIYDNLFEIF